MSCDFQAWRKARKNRGVVTDAPGFCYERCAGGNKLPGGATGLAPRNAQALTAFPQAFAADAELARQFGLGHVVLMLEHEMLEVVLQREILGRLVATGDTADAAE